MSVHVCMHVCMYELSMHACMCTCRYPMKLETSDLPGDGIIDTCECWNPKCSPLLGSSHLNSSAISPFPGELIFKKKAIFVNVIIHFALSVSRERVGILQGKD